MEHTAVLPPTQITMSGQLESRNQGRGSEHQEKHVDLDSFESLMVEEQRVESL